MKKVLIGICLLMGCGDAAGATPETSSQSVERPGEFAGVGGAGGDGGTATQCRVDADCKEGFVCKPYSGACLPAPRPCEPGEVLVELSLAVITDQNGVPYPHGDVDPVEVFSSEENLLYGNAGHPVALGGWHHVMFEGGNPLNVNVEFHVVDFELGGFDVDFGDELSASFRFECTFTVEELVAGDGEVSCDQEDGYRLSLTYATNTETCE